MKRIVIDGLPEEKARLVEAFSDFLRAYPLSHHLPRPVPEPAPSLHGAFPELRSVTDAAIEEAEGIWEAASGGLAEKSSRGPS